MITMEQLDKLKNFRLTDVIIEGDLTISMLDFFEEDKWEVFMNHLQQELQAPTSKVTASIFMKRYAFLAVIQLYCMTVYNRRLPINFENLVVVEHHSDNHWLPTFYFRQPDLEEVEREGRLIWREETIKKLFAEHMYPLIDLFVRKTKVANIILWENIAVYIYWLYENVIPALEDKEAKKRGEADFQYLMEEAAGDLFGYNQNPLKRFYHEKRIHPDLDIEIRPRKTCCFSYKIKDGKHCIICPHTCRFANGGS